MRFGGKDQVMKTPQIFKNKYRRKDKLYFELDKWKEWGNNLVFKTINKEKQKGKGN